MKTVSMLQYVTMDFAENAPIPCASAPRQCIAFLHCASAQCQFVALPPCASALPRRYFGTVIFQSRTGQPFALAMRDMPVFGLTTNGCLADDRSGSSE